MRVKWILVKLLQITIHLRILRQGSSHHSIKYQEKFQSTPRRSDVLLETKYTVPIAVALTKYVMHPTTGLVGRVVRPNLVDDVYWLPQWRKRIPHLGRQNSKQRRNKRYPSLESFRLLFRWENYTPAHGVARLKPGSKLVTTNDFYGPIHTMHFTHGKENCVLTLIVSCNPFDSISLARKRRYYILSKTVPMDKVATTAFILVAKPMTILAKQKHP